MIFIFCLVDVDKEQGAYGGKSSFFPFSFLATKASWERPDSDDYRVRKP